MKRRACLLALAVLLVGAGTADAREFRFVGEGRVWADGDRYAAITLKDQPVRVIDDVAHRSWSVTPPGPNCHVVGVAARNVLWSCPPARLLQQLGSDATRPLPGWDAYLAWFESIRHTLNVPSDPYLEGFGRRWVAATYGCDRCGLDLTYIDWRTGRLVRDVRNPANKIVDLDDPDLEVTLCEPLRRRVPPDGFEDDAGGFFGGEYRPPWYVPEGPPLRLRHCDERKPVLSLLCECRSITLGRRYLLWLERSYMRAFDLVKRRRVSVGGLRRTPGLTLYATRNTLYVANELYVYSAPMPRFR